MKITGRLNGSWKMKNMAISSVLTQASLDTLMALGISFTAGSDMQRRISRKDRSLEKATTIFTHARIYTKWSLKTLTRACTSVGGIFLKKQES